MKYKDKSTKIGRLGLRGYELPTNLQNFTQKDLTEVKLFQKVLGGYFFEAACSLVHCRVVRRSRRSVRCLCDISSSTSTMLNVVHSVVALFTSPRRSKRLNASGIDSASNAVRIYLSKRNVETLLCRKHVILVHFISCRFMSQNRRPSEQRHGIRS